MKKKINSDFNIISSLSSLTFHLTLRKICAIKANLVKLDLGGSGGGEQFENSKDKNHQVIKIEKVLDELKISQYHKQGLQNQNKRICIH